MLKKSIFMTVLAVGVLWMTQSFGQVIVQITPNQWQDRDWREHHENEWKYWHKHHRKEWKEWQHDHHDHDD